MYGLYNTFSIIRHLIIIASITARNSCVVFMDCVVRILLFTVTLMWECTFVECTEGFYGLECQETCVCVTGECDPVNGTCTCPPGHFGADCSHG